MSSSLVVYGVPFSQPFRAVAWLLLHKQTSFELALTNPGSSGTGGSRHPDYLEKFPSGTIPGLEDKESGLLISESHAIMCYLCSKFGWEDLYPARPEQRALIDGYLHFHHRNIREASIGFVAPKIRRDLNFSEDVLRISQTNFTRGLKILEKSFLDRNSYLVGEQITIADFSAYVEIGQLQSRYTNLYEFSDFPNIKRWLGDMGDVAYHDDIHVPLQELGDIRDEAPSMESIIDANKKGLIALRTKLVR